LIQRVNIRSCGWRLGGVVLIQPVQALGEMHRLGNFGIGVQK
jgi:hypothetical protein